MTLNSAISITIPADVAWASLAQAAAENGANVFGLPSAKSLRLTMGVEELLLYLADTLHGKEITITIRPGSTFVAAEVEFESVGTDLSALNLTASATDDVDDVFASMPLLLASRMTDGFHVERRGGKTCITLKVNRVYPEIEPSIKGRRDVRGEVSIVSSAEPAIILDVCTAVRGLYPPHLVPVWFTTPGKVVDMIASGELDILIAQDDSGAICGMICWEKPSKESVGFYGPYSFVDEATVSALLLEGLVLTVGRTAAKIVFSNIATENLSEKGFELLTEVEYHRADDVPSVLPIWCRQLREDFGASVWSHPDQLTYLEERYDDLVLMRDIRLTSEIGERVSDKSVFATKLSRELSEAMLRPQLNGSDNALNLKRHVEALRKEGFKNIFFHVDLSSGWQAALGGDLAANGFIPAMLLPHGGQSDVVMFQYVEPAA